MWNMRYSKLIRLCGLAWAALLLSATPPSVPNNVSLKMAKIQGLYGDRLTTYGYLMRPRVQNQPSPAVILLHGGFQAGSGEWIVPEGGLALKLVQAGYIAFALDYRGSGNHGEQFDKLDNLGTSAVDDVRSALKLLQSWEIVDPHRIAVIGTSRGATMALRAAEMTDQIKLVVGYSSVVDYRIFYCQQGCATSAESKRWCETLSRQEKIKIPPAQSPTKFCQYLKDAAGCNPWESACHVFVEGSPLLHLDQLHTPVLLHHSEADTTAFFPAVLELNRQMDRLRIPHKLFVYSTQDYGPVDHGFLYPALPSYNQAAADVAWKRTIQALDYYLKGKGARPW